MDWMKNQDSLPAYHSVIFWTAFGLVDYNAEPLDSKIKTVGCLRLF